MLRLNVKLRSLKTFSQTFLVIKTAQSGNVFISFITSLLILHILSLALVDEEYDRLPSASIRSFLTEVSFPDTPTRWKSLSDFNLLEYENEGNHGHRISGYFFARETGKYKFFGTCPNGCRLYLSDDDTCNKRSLVLEYQSPFAKSTRYDLKGLIP